MSRFKLFSLIFCCLLAALSLCSCELAMEAMYGTPAFTKVNVLVYGNEYSNAYTIAVNEKGEQIKAKVNPLNFTTKDANQVGQAVEALGKESKIECNAKYIVSGTASTSKKNFIAEMNNLAKNSTASELTIIFFSCHGFIEGSETKIDYSSKPQTSFAMCENNGDMVEFYTHEEFKEDLAKIKGTKVVFADVCYSGGLVDSSNVSINPNEYSGIDGFSLFWDYQVCENSNTFCLTASRYNQESYEDSFKEHGVFTYVLLEAFGWDEEKQKITGKSGPLTFFDICQYVIKNNKSSGSRRQDPMLNSGSNDIVLFYIK